MLTGATLTVRGNVCNLGASDDSVFSLSGDKEGHKVMTVSATLGSLPDRQEEIVYTGLRIIGNGSFGLVYQAKLVEPCSEVVAIKKVLQDKRFKVLNDDTLSLILTVCLCVT